MLSIRLVRAWLRALAPGFVAPRPSASRTEHGTAQGASTAANKHAARSGDMQAVHDLLQAHTLTLAEPLGHALECVQGCIWITQDGDPRDVVIKAGQVFTPDRNERTLIYALEASQLRVSQPVH